MSATQLDKVFASLHKLERGMVGVSEHITTSRGEVSIGGEKTQRSPLTLYREDASVLNCKRGILSAQTSFDNMKQSIASLSNSSAMQSAEPLASLSELALKDAEDGSKELEVAKLTPVV
jgi:ABC-type Na+ transport system ATPase subunit NatA